MSTIIQDNIFWDINSPATCVYDFLSAHDNRFSLDSTNQALIINNVCQIKMYKDGNNSLYEKLICNDESHTEYVGQYAGSYFNTNTVNVNYIRSGDFTRFEMYNPSRTTYQLGFDWFKLGTSDNAVRLYRNGYNNIQYRDTNYSWPGPINTNNGSNEYYYVSQNMTGINISIQGKLMFTNKCFMNNYSGTIVHPLDGLYSCSTVPQGSYISIEGINYYAIGPNTLVPLQ
jgi:hypothetical protein